MDYTFTQSGLYVGEIPNGFSFAMNLRKKYSTTPTEPSTYHLLSIVRYRWKLPKYVTSKLTGSTEILELLNTAKAVAAQHTSGAFPLQVYQGKLPNEIMLYVRLNRNWTQTDVGRMDEAVKSLKKKLRLIYK